MNKLIETASLESGLSDNFFSCLFDFVIWVDEGCCCLDILSSTKHHHHDNIPSPNLNDQYGRFERTFWHFSWLGR